MVRVMSIKDSLNGLCYDIQLKLSKRCDEEVVLEWAKKKILLTEKHWLLNKKYREGSLKYHKAVKPWKIVKKKKHILEDINIYK